VHFRKGKTSHGNKRFIRASDVGDCFLAHNRRVAARCILRLSLTVAQGFATGAERFHCGPPALAVRAACVT
jgi:hypothetical protein